MIQTESGKLYTGITNDLKRRFKEHAGESKGARFFHFSGPQKIVFQETYPNRSEALKREAFIKKLTRRKKLELLGDGFAVDASLSFNKRMSR